MVTGLGYSFINRGWLNFLTKKLYKITTKFNNAIIFENKDDRSLFVNHKLVDRDKAYTVKGCGINTKYFKPHYENSQKEITVFTFIGRLLKDKGIVEFAESAKNLKAKHSNCIFQVLGEFDRNNPSTIDRRKLLKWIHENDIEYHGYVRDVRPYIKNSDCIVLPSYREGLPKVLLEGMAMGKPIITTDTAGCRETVDNGQNGFLVKIKDVQQLQIAMEKIIAIGKLGRIELGKKGREKVVREFEEKKIAKHIYSIINEI